MFPLESYNDGSKRLALLRSSMFRRRSHKSRLRRSPSVIKRFLRLGLTVLIGGYVDRVLKRAALSGDGRSVVFAGDPNDVFPREGV